MFKKITHTKRLSNYNHLHKCSRTQLKNVEISCKSRAGIFTDSRNWFILTPVFSDYNRLNPTKY